jgi:hypothetical protein
MAVGRKTGGRKKGVPNKVTLAREAEIKKSGLTPLEYMLRVMRNPRAPAERRDDMAKAAAPYVHPKLGSIQHTGANGGPIQTVDLSKLNDDELARLETLLSPLADAGGDQGGEDT